MGSERNTRYDDILRRIEAQKRDRQRAPIRERLADALNELNAVGYLEDVQSEQFTPILCFGPKVISGELWLAAVIWCRPRGYYGYKTLTLLGIWAVSESDDVVIIIGTKTLTFSGQYFNAESYYQTIAERFDLHYAGEISPPSAENRRYSTPYDPARRLDTRRAIESELAKWVELYR